jgi:hypothetical protein
MDWIQLATDKFLVWGLLQNQTTWPAFAVLLLDFAAVISLTDPKQNPEAFGIVYKAFLRFVLVLSHDFRDFMSAVSGGLVTVIPFHFSQIRNIILASGEKSSTIDLFRPIMNPLSQHLNRLFVDGQCDTVELNSVLNELESGCDPASVRYFVLAVCEGPLALRKSDEVEESQTYRILSEAFGSISTDLAALLVNVIVDQVRFKSKESSLYVRLLSGLFASEIHITPQLSLSEVIVRIVMERGVTPPPRPYKLGSLVRKLLATRKIWSMGFVIGNDTVRDFLVAAQTVFNGKQK